MSQHNLVSAQNHAEDMVAPLTANVCVTQHAAFSIPCMCQKFVISLPGWKQHGCV